MARAEDVGLKLLHQRQVIGTVTGDTITPEDTGNTESMTAPTKKSHDTGISHTYATGQEALTMGPSPMVQLAKYVTDMIASLGEGAIVLIKIEILGTMKTEVQKIVTHPAIETDHEVVLKAPTTAARFGRNLTIHTDSANGMRGGEIRSAKISNEVIRTAIEITKCLVLSEKNLKPHRHMTGNAGVVADIGNPNIALTFSLASGACL